MPATIHFSCHHFCHYKSWSSSETKGLMWLFVRPLVLTLWVSRSGDKIYELRCSPFLSRWYMQGHSWYVCMVLNNIMWVVWPPGSPHRARHPGHVGDVCPSWWIHGVTSVSPGRDERQTQPGFSFSFLTITTSQPWLDSQEAESCVRAPHIPQRKNCLWKTEKVGSREYVSVINLFSHWVPMLAHIW